MNWIAVLRSLIFLIVLMPTDILNATVFSTYHYKDYNYDNKKGWMPKSTIYDPSIIVTMNAGSIYISEINTTEVYTFTGDFKVVIDNENKQEIEVECLDRDNKSCRISITKLKASQKTILNVFYVYKYWRQYHVALKDKLTDYETKDWTPLSFDLPDQPVTFYDAGVTSLQHLKNNSVKTYAGLNESDQYRAVVSFSKIGVTALFYDNNNNLVSGLSILRQLRVKDIQSDSVIYESIVSEGKVTTMINIIVFQGVNGPYFIFSSYQKNADVLEWAFIVTKR